MITTLFIINRDIGGYQMNTLKRINGLFTKFWRWIKETAWVQPLLIVGGIFGLVLLAVILRYVSYSLKAGSSRSAFFRAGRQAAKE